MERARVRVQRMSQCAKIGDTTTAVTANLRMTRRREEVRQNMCTATHLVSNGFSHHKISIAWRNARQNLESIIPKLVSLVAKLLKKPIKCRVRLLVRPALEVTSKGISWKVEHDNEKERYVQAGVAVLFSQTPRKGIRPS